MYYGEIKTCDIANGPGVRTTLFVSGCRHHCEGCFQPETWNFEYGKPFTDETKAIIIATDTLLGGSRNYVEAYCNDAALKCNLTLTNMMSTYFLDEERLDDVYISEMLPSKTGWNHPFVLDEIVRGYSAEMQDFMETVAYGKEPLAGFDLAYNTAKVTYAAYLSAQEGRRIDLS